MDGAVEHARLLIGQDMISKTVFNNEGLTPLHLAARAQQSEIANMLLACEGVGVNSEATGRAAGWTPLVYAVVAGSLRLCDMLIRKGADFNEKESTDLPTVLKLAREGDDQEVRDLLVLMWNRRRKAQIYSRSSSSREKAMVEKSETYVLF